MRSVEVRERRLEEGLSLGPALLARARREGVPWLGGSVVRGPAVWLGAGQRAGAVVDLEACRAEGVAVQRRATSGTSAWVGPRALVWSLALPGVNALFPDATVETLLNRNVRGFLKGLTRVGAQAQYYGREWVTVRRAPAAVLGYTLTPDGGVLLEVIAGWEEPSALPARLAAGEERAVKRWGWAPVALEGAVAGGRSPEDVLAAVVRAVAERSGVALEPGEELQPGEGWPEGGWGVRGPDDPAPPGVRWGPAVAVPIGRVEAATDVAGGLHLAGDVLAAGGTLQLAAMTVLGGREEPPPGVVVEGARWEDLIRAGKLALEEGREGGA